MCIPGKKPIYRAMKEKKKDKSEKNLILLIILFSMLSLSIIAGKLLIKNPQRTGRLSASTRIERPEINRVGTESAASVQPAETIEAPEVIQEDPAPVENPVSESRDARLFFFKLDAEGSITLKSVLRPIPSEEYNLENTIKNLMQGPSAADLDKGYLSLIPDGTRLNTVKVVSQTARLDFSEEFSFNPLGYEGFNAQLKQLVYTATEFSQVDQVLFTIEGEIREYINGEGIFTGEPLSRDSF